jgi:hypothetical protein
MRKTLVIFSIVMIVVFLATTVAVNAQEDGTTIEQIETSKGKQRVVVPNSYSDLKEAYLTVSKYYFEERYDRQELADLNQRLIDSIDELTDATEDPLKELERAKRMLQKSTKPTALQSTVSVGAAQSLQPPQTTSVNVGYGVLLWERFSLRVTVGYPFQLGASVGYTF